jgi:cyclomaltodextrinase
MQSREGDAPTERSVLELLMTHVPTTASDSRWADHAVFWHVYPLGFTGAEPRAVTTGVTHRLNRIEAWVDYWVELGCSALALGPIFASESHGYDTVDHFRIDPRLGDESDFVRLADLLHRRGCQLLLDGVFNHVGRSFPRFADALARGDASPSARWFRRSRKGDHEFAVFEGHPSLVALNHDEPQVADYVADVMSHWLARGADGFRLDAAYAVPPRFWQPVLARVRASHPNAWFVGEVIHGDYTAIVTQSGLDSVTQYELWKAIWSSLNDANFFELAWALTRHGEFVERFVPMTFIGNHDVTRIASRLRDIQRLPHALVVLFTVAGVPAIYAGDEQAFRGIKEDREGGDDAVRPAFPDSPAGLAREGWPIYRLHQDLIRLRRQHPWLQRARIEIVTKTNEVLGYRCVSGDNQLSVVLNIGAVPFKVDRRLRALLSSAGVEAGSQLAAATVEPHGWSIYIESR